MSRFIECSLGEDKNGNMMRQYIFQFPHTLRPLRGAVAVYQYRAATVYIPKNRDFFEFRFGQHPEGLFADGLENTGYVQVGNMVAHKNITFLWVVRFFKNILMTDAQQEIPAVGPDPHQPADQIPAGDLSE